MIYIKLSKELDYNTYETFKDLCFAGLDFGEEIRQFYPDLSPGNYKDFINEYYLAHKAEMLEQKKRLDSQISQISPKLFSVIGSLFSKDYSKETYTGYLSMFYCNPRYLHDNFFQIYYKRNRDELLKTIFHETLHFAFFDYCKSNIKKAREFDCDNGPLWELSEIFNTLILNSKAFQQIFPVQHNLCYPALTEKYHTIEKIWQEGASITQFLEKSLKKLSD